MTLDSPVSVEMKWMAGWPARAARWRSTALWQRLRRPPTNHRAKGGREKSQTWVKGSAQSMALASSDQNASGSSSDADTMSLGIMRGCGSRRGARRARRGLCEVGGGGARCPSLAHPWGRRRKARLAAPAESALHGGRASRPIHEMPAVKTDPLTPRRAARAPLREGPGGIPMVLGLLFALCPALVRGAEGAVPAPAVPPSCSPALEAASAAFARARLDDAA